MNEKRLNSVLLLAILATMLAVIGVHYLPEKKLLLAPGPNEHASIFSKTLADGTQTAEWVDQSHFQWKCNYPVTFNEEYFPCSMIINLTGSKINGIDLSQYSHLNLKIHYEGSANKIRVAMRNFDAAYSKEEDDNSTKFNSLHIHTSELSKEVALPLKAFAVSDWWLAKYNIHLAHAQPDISNSIQITIDFSEQLNPGIHKFTLEKLEFQGEWISAEHWYLIIICCWMLGIFIYAIRQMLILHQKRKYDLKVIKDLSTSNEQLKDETNKFRRLSTVDPLTQTYNRFGIDQIVSTLTHLSLDKVKNKNAPTYAMAILDIDHFKQVNDRRGHDAGDRVLQEVSAIAQKHTRTTDFLGRWGGEEFVIIMSNTNKHDAMELAEKIRRSVADYCFEPNNPLQLTISFGVGERKKDEDFASTFKRIDNALYQAKNAGRNRCIYADD